MLGAGQREREDTRNLKEDPRDNGKNYPHHDNRELNKPTASTLDADAHAGDTAQELAEHRLELGQGGGAPENPGHP